MNLKKHRTASEILEDIVDQCKEDSLSFDELKKSLHERGFGLLMILFSLILAMLPPGLSAIPAVPIFIFSLQMIAGADYPWLPKWLEEKRITRKNLSLIVDKSSPYLKKLEKFLQPRLTFASSPLGERIVGIFALVFSSSILIPLPLTNFFPALGVALMSLGLLGKDGLLVILGMIIGTAGVAFTISMLFFGQQALAYINPF
jgi:hypothetical protein